MSGYNSEYKCNCDASAGAPDHARTCPEHRDYGKISGKDIVDAFDTGGASTVPHEPVPAADRLAYLDKLLPQVAEITHYLSQNGLGTIGEDCLPRALELIKQCRYQIQQRDELLAKCRKTQKRLAEVADPILQNHGVSVGYFGAARRNVAAIDAMFPGAFTSEDAQ